MLGKYTRGDETAHMSVVGQKPLSRAPTFHVRYFQR
jgi:hypothetical protein